MNVFISTKPIQVLFCVLLSKRFENTRLILTNEFSGAEKVHKSEYLLKYFKSVSLVGNRYQALLRSVLDRPNNIFLDSDVGLRPWFFILILKLISPNSKVCVYEEGIGTYRNDLVKSKYKAFIYRVLGAGQRFGGCIFTSILYVSSIPRYLSVHGSFKKLQEVPEFKNFWSQSELDVDLIFGCNEFKLQKKQSSEAFIYLTDWVLNESVVTDCEGRGEVDLYLKPHPNIKSFDSSLLGKRWVLLSAGFPAEFALIKLASTYEKLTVVHNNSSTVFYLKGVISFEESKILC